MLPKQLLSPLAISLGVACANLEAEEIHDWSGPYLGGMIGYSNTRVSPKGSGGEFNGDIYNSMNSIEFDGQGELFKSFNLPLIANNSSYDDGASQGTVLVGQNFQDDHIVFGGELRSSFGNFGASSNLSIQGSGSLYGNDFEGFAFSMTNQNSVLSGDTSPFTFNGFADFNGTYEQKISQKNEIKFDNVTSLVGRLGWAQESFLWYLMAGINYANVRASTHTTITETASGTITTPTTRNFSGSLTYLFSGEDSKSMLGYTLGAGVDWAINEKFILRVEGEYHDLGTISVTGTSNQGAYSYKLKQDITGYSLATGLMYRF